MKSAFAALPLHEVTLHRDGPDGPLDQVVTLRPWPLGYPEYVSRVYPPPVIYRNLEPVEDPKQASEYASNRALILLARSLGDQIDAKGPAGDGDRSAWHAYAVAIRDELSAANLVEGDVSLLIAEAMRVNRGGGKLPKA